MRVIRDVADRELTWSQPSMFASEYELHAGGDLAGSLAFRSSFGTFATGATGDGVWTFKRVGFWKSFVTIREQDSPDDLARYEHATWSFGGTLELVDGRKYHLDTNFWQTEFKLMTEGDRPLVVFRKISGVFHASSIVDVRPEARSLDELPWMVLLGWYLTVMMQRDTAAVVVS